MKIKSLTPMLWTDKLAESIDFYTKILGFNCVHRNDDWGWAALQNGKVEIMLAKPNEYSKHEKLNFTGTFYFSVENVDEIWDKLKEKAKIVYPIENFPWQMREFCIYDNNQYMLQFGQELNEN